MRKILLAFILIGLSVNTEAQLLFKILQRRHSSTPTYTIPNYSTEARLMFPSFKPTILSGTDTFIVLRVDGLTPNYGYSKANSTQGFRLHHGKDTRFKSVDYYELDFQDDSIVVSNGSIAPAASRDLLRADNDTITNLGGGINTLPFKLHAPGDNIASGDNIGPFGFAMDYHSDNPTQLGQPYATYNWYAGHGLPAVEVTRLSGTFGYNNIGAWYHDSLGHRWRLARPTASNKAFFISNNTSTEGGLAFVYNYDMNGTRLYYDSLGVDTSSFLFTSVNDGRAIYGLTSFKNDFFYINGNRVSLDSQSTFTNVKSFQIDQTVTIFDPNSTLDSIVKNRPGGAGYTHIPPYWRGHGIIKMHHIVDAQDGDVDVSYTAIEMLDTMRITGYQNTMEEFGIVNGVWKPRISASSYGAYKVTSYVPNLLPISDGGTLHDYRVGNNTLDSPFNASVEKDSSNYTKYPFYRFDVMKAVNSGDTFSINMVMGRQPMESSGTYWISNDSARNRNAYAIYMFGTQKNYLTGFAFPTATFGKLLYPGTIIRLIEYKGYPPTPITSGMVSEFTINVNDTLRYHAYYNATGTYSIPVPAGYTLYQYSPARKSDNISISGSSVTVDNSTPITFMGNTHHVADFECYFLKP